MILPTWKWILPMILVPLASVSVRASSPERSTADAPVSFIRDVAPILKESCFGCHGVKNPKGKLDMTRFDRLRHGGTKDDPIVPGKSSESYLIEVLSLKDKGRMPPAETGDPLPRAKIEVIARWIDQGARLDPEIKPDQDLVRELRRRWVPPAPRLVYQYPVAVTALTFTPDNQHLVVGGNHELTVWDLNSARLEKRLATRPRRAQALIFLPDGKLVAAGGRPGEEGNVGVYNLNSSTAKVVGGVQFLDGVNDKTVLVKQLLDADDEVLCLARSPDGKKLISGGCDRQINIWNLSNGLDQARQETPIENHSDWVFGLAVSSDGERLFTASRDKTAKVLALASRQSVLTFADHQQMVYSVAVSSDGKRGFSVGDDNQLRIWNTGGSQPGRQVRTLGHPKPVLKVAPVPGKPLLVTAGADGQVRVFSTETSALVKTLNGCTDQVYALAISSDGKFVAAGAFNGEVRIWEIDDGTLLKAFNASPGLKGHLSQASTPKR